MTRTWYKRGPHGNDGDGAIAGYFPLDDFSAPGGEPIRMHIVERANPKTECVEYEFFLNGRVHDVNKDLDATKRACERIADDGINVRID